MRLRVPRSRVIEALERGRGVALSRPHDGAVPVVVGDDHEVAVALSPDDLVDADPVELVELTVVDPRDGDPYDDAGDRLSRDAEHLRPTGPALRRLESRSQAEGSLN